MRQHRLETPTLDFGFERDFAKAINRMAHLGEGSGSEPVNPQVAIAGFPSELDSWAWHRGDPQVFDLGSPEHIWRSEWPGEERLVEVRRISEANQQWWRDHDAALEERRGRPFAASLPFRPPPVSGKGKWHVSYADANSFKSPEWVVSPERTPACGSPTFGLDPEGLSITPDVGDRISQYEDRLCGNCVVIAQMSRVR